MMFDTSATSFSHLSRLGLISEKQRNSALDHPKLSALSPAASPARCLAWMVEQRIISYAEFDDGPVDIPDEADERYEEFDKVLDEAETEIDKIGPRMNAALLDELVRDGFITKSQRDSAVGAPFVHILDTPAQALAYVLVTNSISQADFDALRTRARHGQGAEHLERRLRLVEDAATEVGSLRSVCLPPAQTVRRHGLHGGLQLLIGCAFLMGGYLLYQFCTSVPFCGSSKITDSIRFSLYSAGMKVDRHGNPRIPKITHVKEIGHARAHRLRGCTATVEFDEKSLPYTYVVVGLSAGRRVKASFIDANHTIVETRFSNIGFGGSFGNKAEPIGRDNLEAAFIAGVDRLRYRLIPSQRKILPDVRDSFTLANMDRKREIADVEPVGDCRALQPGTRYACRVIVERNDPRWAFSVKNADILDAEFTFEHNEAGTEWRVADDFAERYAQAIARAGTAVPVAIKKD